MRRTADLQGKSPILAIESVCLASREAPGSEVMLDLVLYQQDLVLVDAGDEAPERLIIDAACGLTPPQKGQVSFLGHAWEDLPPNYANAMRGRIGHGFGAGAWVPYLSLADNILLGQHFHTRRPEAELLSEASRLAYRFGLPGLPSGPIGTLSATDRQRATLVRAFLGMPPFIILGSQSEDSPPDLRIPLIDLVFEVRQRRAAVLWFTSANDLLFDATLLPTARFRLQDRELIPVEDVA